MEKANSDGKAEGLGGRKREWEIVKETGNERGK